MIKTLADSVRPVLTYFYAFTFISAGTYAVLTQKLDWTIYFSTVGTMVSMMVSFWFGERSALKNPTRDAKMDELVSQLQQKQLQLESLQAKAPKPAPKEGPKSTPIAS